MTTWFKDSLKIPLLPDDTTAEIIGLYNSDTDHTHHTSIELSIIDPEKTINYIIYSHQIKTISKQKPTIDEISDRYKDMILKYHATYSDIDYNLINFKKFKSYSPEASSL